MATNTAKYLSYAEAWRRIKAATAQGFHFEVVTLCESIISDRLLSYVRGINPSGRVNVRTPFASLISEWRNLAGKDIPPYGTSNLGAAVSTWRVERNTVYADDSSIKTVGVPFFSNRVKMVELFDYTSSTKSTLANKPFRSTLGTTEYDCKERRMRSLSSAFYSENKGKGEVLYSNTVPDDKWVDVISFSHWGGLFQVACGKR